LTKAPGQRLEWWHLGLGGFLNPDIQAFYIPLGHNMLEALFEVVPLSQDGIGLKNTFQFLPIGNIQSVKRPEHRPVES
jgi:hypothetical protein